MKKQCFIYGIIFILLALILEFSLLYVNAEHFISTMILGIVLIFGGAVLVISGITGKAPFTGKELKQVETKPKKQYNLKKTFIITGIIQAIFFILYLASGLYVIFAPELDRKVLDFFGASMALIPVIPVCFCCNVIALISLRYKNGKIEKEGRKWLYIILSAMAMSVAWCFGMIPIITIF